MTYLITFACYGWHLHGDENGSVDRKHNRYGNPILDDNPTRRAAERNRMDQACYYMDEIRRIEVLKAIQDVCSHRGWNLLAAHVRTNHVHVVIDADEQPERIMNAFKAWASRRLNAMGIDRPDRKRWARHGSTRFLWKPENVTAAIGYVVDEQCEPMAVYVEEVR